MAKSSEAQSLSNLAQLFRLLSDKTRLQIVLLLAEGERNFSAALARISVEDMAQWAKALN